MKRNIFIIMVLSILLVGCDIGSELANTPTKQVEIFLTKYQTLDKDVLDDLDLAVASDEFSPEQRVKYKEIMKKGYQKLKYEIKDEKLDGDEAFVTVDIEVVDYSVILSRANTYLKNHPEEFYDEDGIFDGVKFTDYRLDKLKEADDTVRYTLDFHLIRKNERWRMDSLSNEDEEKIHGTYVY